MSLCGKIPFEIRGDKTESTSDGLKAFKELRAMAESGRFPEMTLDEINDEIALARNGK